MKILQSQTERRDQILWLKGLRGESAPHVHRQGLKQIVLKRNRLGSNFARALQQFLKFDTYMRAIDVTFNAINEESVSELAVALEDNKTITCLDLNDNPGLTPSFHKTIALLLVRNIDHLKRSRCQIKKQWVKKGTIYFKVPQQSKPTRAPSKAP